MFRPFAIATIVALGAVAPAVGDEAKPHQFAQPVADAIGFLTIQSHPRPFTRDTQIGDGTFGRYEDDRAHRSSARAQVFASEDAPISRSLNGYRGFNGGNLKRIDR